MPEATAEQTQPRETFLHTVVVDVPTEETGARMTRLLEVLNKIDATEADKASRVSDFNAEIKQLNKEAHKLREAITTGKERRDVECYEQPDERRNIVFIVRASDGKVIDERAMTLEDRMYSGADKAKAEAAEREANGSTSDAPPPGGANDGEDKGADAVGGSGGGGTETAKASGGGKLVRIKPSDAKKRKAAREAKEAADKARKLADENDAANAAARADDDSDDDSDE